MARTVITAFALLAACRVRIAGALDKKDEGTCAFVAGGKVFDNSKYDSSWHTFPEGTKFEVACLVDKTDTYCLLAKEKVKITEADEEGNETSRIKTETNGVFLRRKSYEKLLEHAEPTILETKKPEVEFGTPIDEVVEETPETDVIVEDVTVMELDEDEPTDAELDALEDEVEV